MLQMCVQTVHQEPLLLYLALSAVDNAISLFNVLHEKIQNLFTYCRASERAREL
jgi:hypothetical protein